MMVVRLIYIFLILGGIYEKETIKVNYCDDYKHNGAVCAGNDGECSSNGWRVNAYPNSRWC